MDQTTILIEQIPPAFDLEALGRRLHIRPTHAKALDRLAALGEEAKAVARPKAAAKLCSLSFLDNDQTQIDEVIFTSPLLQQNMGELGRAFPYLATEGTELADWALSLPSATDKVFATAFREAVVKQYETLLEKKIMDQYDIKQISAMNPGSLAIWPLTQQESLFQLLDPVPGILGVTLLPSLMMQPEHTVSGVFFQTDTKYYNCQLCPREGCPNRKSPSTVMPGA